jgi:predicted nucleotidyltransferase
VILSEAGKVAMNALEKAIFDRFKERVQQRHPLHKMILFGSRARRDADPESDTDVLVVIEDPRRRSAQRHRQ